jgi:hypothetical protein
MHRALARTRETERDRERAREKLLFAARTIGNNKIL